MSTARGFVCIVDAYSSGSYYPAELHRRGYQSIHVQSADPIPVDDVPSFHREDHAANLIFDGDVDRCVSALAEFKPLAIIAGSEAGVTLADQLSERLGLRTNGTRLSSSRRNKFEMQRTIAAAGLASIPTRMAATWSEVEAYVRENLPVVVKPRESAGTDHVCLCHTFDDARKAFDSIVGKPNTFGIMNEVALVQPLLTGVEYNVNHVTSEGQHLLTDIWRVDKIWGETPVYDRGVVVPSTGEVQDALVSYVRSVIDAIGIVVGPSHAEVMLTKSGPVLLELAARLHGQHVQELTAKGIPYNQLGATIDSYIDPVAFRSHQPRPYRLERHMQRIELICPREGILRGLPREADVRALPSFSKMMFFVERGQPIARTVDVMTIPGFVDLVHTDPEVVERDHDQLRKWESEDFYAVE